MWNIFQKQSGETQRDMVEQNQVLVNLPHVSNVGYNGNPKLAREQTHRDKLADPADARAIRLNNARRACLKEVLKQHPMRNMLANRHADSRISPRQRLMRQHVVGMG